MIRKEAYKWRPGRKAKTMTEREELALSYLSDLMWTDVFCIGRYVRANCLDPAKGGSNLPAIGAALMGRLRKRGFVTYLSDVGAWRITEAGRSALGEQATGEDQK